MVDDDGAEGAQGDTGEGHVAHYPGVVSDSYNHGYSRSVEVYRVREVNLVLHPNTHTQHTDHAVQDRGGAAQHASGNGGNNRAELR